MKHNLENVPNNEGEGFFFGADGEGEDDFEAMLEHSNEVGVNDADDEPYLKMISDDNNNSKSETDEDQETDDEIANKASRSSESIEEESEPVENNTPNDINIEDNDVFPDQETDNFLNSIDTAPKDPFASEPEPEPMNTTQQEISQPQEETNFVPEESEPTEEEKQQMFQPVKQNPEPKPFAPKIHIPSEQDMIDEADKIIKTLDAYRKLKTDEKEVAVQFLAADTNTEIDPKNETQVVVKAIRADDMLTTTMETFKKIKSLEPVDRAFFIIDMEDNLFNSVLNLTRSFFDEKDNIYQDLPKHKIARLLVSKFDEIDDEAIKYIAAAGSVLSASK